MKWFRFTNGINYFYVNNYKKKDDEYLTPFTNNSVGNELVKNLIFIYSIIYRQMELYEMKMQM